MTFKERPYEGQEYAKNRYLRSKEDILSKADQIIEDPSDLNNALELAEMIKMFFEELKDE